jgi:hypothetical protein
MVKSTVFRLSLIGEREGRLLSARRRMVCWTRCAGRMSMLATFDSPSIGGIGDAMAD